MNGNDLFDALSGLDNTYIDEAAFELHGTPASKQKKAKIVKIRKTLLIAIPSAAAILLVVALAMPFAISHKRSESAASAPSAPAMDTAAEAPAKEAAAEATEDIMAEAPAAEYASEAEAPAMDLPEHSPRRLKNRTHTMRPKRKTLSPLQLLPRMQTVKKQPELQLYSKVLIIQKEYLLSKQAGSFLRTLKI